MRILCERINSRTVGSRMFSARVLLSLWQWSSAVWKVTKRRKEKLRQVKGNLRFNQSLEIDTLQALISFYTVQFNTALNIIVTLIDHTEVGLKLLFN